MKYLYPAIPFVLLLAFSSMSARSADTPLLAIPSDEAAHGRSIAYQSPWLVVGAPNAVDSAGNEGKVLIYRKMSSGADFSDFQLVQTLSLAALGISGQPFASFGWSVAIAFDGRTLVVGAPSSGVYVYTLPYGGSSWSYSQGLHHVDYGFGSSVDISRYGERIIVGAPHSNYSHGGSISIYAKTSTNPSDPAYRLTFRTFGEERYSAFGKAVAVDVGSYGNYPDRFVYIVGAPGTIIGGVPGTGLIRVFSEFLSPGDPATPIHLVGTFLPTAVSEYGTSIDLDRGLLIVGAPHFSGGDFAQSGGAYIYRLVHEEQDRVDVEPIMAPWTAFDGGDGQHQSYARFGSSVSIRKLNNDIFTAVSGAPLMDRNGGTDRGAAFVMNSWYGDAHFWQVSNPQASSYAREGTAVALTAPLYFPNAVITGSPNARSVQLYNRVY